MLVVAIDIITIHESVVDNRLCFCEPREVVKLLSHLYRAYTRYNSVVIKVVFVVSRVPYRGSGTLVCGVDVLIFFKLIYSEEESIIAFSSKKSYLFYLISVAYGCVKVYFTQVVGYVVHNFICPLIDKNGRKGDV